jgi:hypothetical protein
MVLDVQSLGHGGFRTWALHLLMGFWEPRFGKGSIMVRQVLMYSMIAMIPDAKSYSEYEIIINIA